MNGLWLCYDTAFICNYMPEEVETAIQDAKHVDERGFLWVNVKLNGQQIYPPLPSYQTPPRPESSAGPARPSSHIARDGVEIVGRLSEMPAAESSAQFLRLTIELFEAAYMKRFPPPSKTSDARPREKPHLQYIRREEQQKLRGRR